MSQAGSSGLQPAAPGSTGAALLPPIWVGVNILLAVYGIYSTLPAINSYELPDGALYLIYAGLGAAVVNLLWGLWLVALAVSGSASFPRHFIVWQAVNIVWIVLREAYVLAAPVFVFTLTPLLYGVAEIAIGVICILLLRRRPAVAAVHASEGGRPPAIVSIIAGILGLIIGGALGFGIGLGIGIAISEATDMSCFEGACGFFVFFVGLGGILVGAVAGAILAVWLVNRRRRVAPQG